MIKLVRNDNKINVSSTWEIWTIQNVLCTLPRKKQMSSKKMYTKHLQWIISNTNFMNHNINVSNQIEHLLMFWNLSQVHAKFIWINSQKRIKYLHLLFRCRLEVFTLEKNKLFPLIHITLGHQMHKNKLIVKTNII